MKSSVNPIDPNLYENHVEEQEEEIVTPTTNIFHIKVSMSDTAFDEIFW